MRFSAPSLFGLFALLSASVVAMAQPDGDTDFMSVRENVAKDYESEGEIPTQKYFSKPHSFGLIRAPALAMGGLALLGSFTDSYPF